MTDPAEMQLSRRCDRTVARVAAVLAAALLAASVAGCGEKPQLLNPEASAIEGLQRDGELRERTLNQGDAERMSY